MNRNTQTCLVLFLVAVIHVSCAGRGSQGHGTALPPLSAPSGDAVVVQAEMSREEAPSYSDEDGSVAFDAPPMPSSEGGGFASGPPPSPVAPARITATPSGGTAPPPPAPPAHGGGYGRGDGHRTPAPDPTPAPEAVRPARPMARDAEAPVYEAEEAAPSMAMSGGEDDRSGSFGPPPPAPGVDAMYGAPIVAQPQIVQVVRRLTAATVADVDRRQNYLGYLARHHAEASMLGLDMSRRVRFRVVDGQDRPVHDAALTVVSGGAQVRGRTHADGWWDFFPGVNAPQSAGNATVFIAHSGGTSRATVPIPGQGDGRDIVIRLPQAVAVSPAVLDLAFLIDVTGSMSDELRYVNEEVVGIVGRVRASVPQVQVRVGATFYRDRGDYVPLEQIPFSSDINQFVSRMRFVRASGGGDYPEDVNAGLAAALNTLQWSTGPAVRVLVVIADAPPQMYPDFQYTYTHGMSDAARRGIRILPVAASGSDRTVEFLFRAMGTYTSTPYMYLTDDSGIGGHHMEADTDRVAIEMFSDALTRLLISDLQGQGMHEPIADRSVLVPGQ